MGVEYTHWLIPKPNTFKPTSQSLAIFIQELERQRWLPDPLHYLNDNFTYNIFTKMEYYKDRLPEFFKRFQSLRGRFIQVETSYISSRIPAPRPCTIAWLEQQMEHEMLLNWELSDFANLNVRYPLARMDYPADEIYYDLSIHFAQDFLYQTNETIQPLKSEDCPCGIDLYYLPQKNLFNCGRLRTECYLCRQVFDPSALPVNCVTSPSDNNIVLGGAIYHFAVVIECGKCTPQQPVTIAPELKDLCQQIFQCSFYDLGGYH